MGIVRSTRLAGGMPLGGIGCGGFELMTDGSISRATFNNNWDQPTGDLKGNFAAIWTSGGGRVVAKALQLNNAFGLPSVSPVEFRGQFPQAMLEFPDKDLPVRVSCRAISALVPHDVKNSSIPAAIFVFRVTNQARGPVEVSVALSWENILGVGGSASEGAFSDRTGNTVSNEPVTQGMFAVRLGSRLSALRPESRLRYNAAGNYTVMAEATTPETIVTRAGWNAFDSTPAWWGPFAKNGVVEGTAPIGVEGSVHPAGVVAMKVALKDGETREMPFAVAWYTPRLWTTGASEYGHYYQNSFDDSVAVARSALQNRLALSALTDEWQGSLLRSTLPAWLSRKLANDAATLFTNTVLTRDSGLAGTKPGPSLFGILESPVDGKGGLGAMDHLHLAAALHSGFYSRLHLQLLQSYRSAQSPTGEIPRQLGNVERELIPSRETEPTAESEARPDVQCAYAALVFRYYRTAGDQKFMDEFYPSAKHALQFAATLDANGDGIPDGKSVYGEGFDSYNASMWLGALRVGQKMAEVMQDRSFSSELSGLATRAQSAFRALWNGQYLRLRAGSDLSLESQLSGAWLAHTTGAADLLPRPEMIKALEGLSRLNGSPALPAPKLLAAPGGAALNGGGSWPAHSAVYHAAALARIGNADEALALMRRIDRLNWAAGRPWQAPLTYEAETGRPQWGRSHLANASSWAYYEALLGLDVDLSEGMLMLAPRLPSSLKSLAAPVFSPTFTGWLDYRPTPRRSVLSFRLDRTIPGATRPVRLQSGVGLTLKRVIIPTHGDGMPQVFASIGRGPVPGKAEKDPEGRIAFTFETPVKLTAGQRLEFILR